MQTGLYSVEFSSGTGSFGAGIIVFTGDKVYGGDAGYYYTGSVEAGEGTTMARIRVGHHHGERNSIFGSLNEFNLDLTGSLTQDAVNFSGHVVEHPAMKIAIKGRRVSGL